MLTTSSGNRQTKNTISVSEMKADTSDSLASIRSQCQAPISSILLEIQKHGYLERKSLDWIKNLECLHMVDSGNLNRKRRHEGDDNMGNERGKKLLRRKRIHALYPSERNYVAVSYTWEASKSENASFEGYIVESRETRVPIPSKVRDRVLDRVTRYVKYCKSEAFWIDQENIYQNDPMEMEIAMQSMGHVYSFSHFPVGLLSVRIESKDQMGLLIDLLRGEFIKSEEKSPSPEFKFGVSMHKASKALDLLEHLTSDLWWTRAWTFQEDYRASVKMVLLISHHPSLEKQKRDVHPLLGDLAGEICVKSADFRKEATKFCIAYQKCGQDQDICQKILERAGKYNVLLRETYRDGGSTICRSMSPIIFADIGRRGITNDSDRLAVTANCCGYPVRLNTETLRAKNCSLSLGMLALYLLNGEIIMNNDQNNTSALSDDIFDYLKKQSLDNFRPPLDHSELTFIKSCRFLKATFSEEGIETVGHLWKLGKIVTGFPHKKTDESGSHDGLNSYQRGRLRQLANKLESGHCGGSYKEIAGDLNRYLDEDEYWESNNFSKQYKDLMAEEVVEAMRTRKKLRLACLVPVDHEQPQKASIPYRGIFVSEANGEWDEQTPSYIFTASYPAQENTDNIDKHVSLEVEWQGSTSEDRPRLVTKRWINGLCFFDGCHRRDVVFCWPTSLTE